MKFFIILVIFLVLVNEGTAFFRQKNRMKNSEKNLAVEAESEVHVPKNNIWPHLEGVHFEEAKAAILKEHPGIKISTVPEGSFVTGDFRDDRVRLFVDKDGKVARKPMIG